MTPNLKHIVIIITSSNWLNLSSLIRQWHITLRVIRSASFQKPSSWMAAALKNFFWPVLEWLHPPVDLLSSSGGLVLLKSCRGLFAPPLPVWACWHPLQRSWIVGTPSASEGWGSEERRSLILPSTWRRLLGATRYRLARSANLCDCRPLAEHING